MTTVFGLFERPEDAGRALDDLVASGTAREAVSVLTRGGAAVAEAPKEGLAEHDAEKGALVGGLAGLMLGLADLTLPGVGALLAGGWIMTTVLGAGLGVAAGGLVGALAELGMSHEHAGRIEQGLRRGGTVLAVRTGAGGAPSVRDILQRHRATDIHASDAADASRMAA